MTLITRYAEGFLEYAKEAIGFEQGLEELKKVKGVFRDNPQFPEFLENPAINYTKKCDVIDKVLISGFSREMRDFLKLLLKKGRIDKIVNIAEYAIIKYSHGKSLKTLLCTSYLMDTQLMKKFKDALESRLKTKLQLYVDLAPDLLGGARVVMGNKVLDGSVKRRLEDLREKLLAAKVG